MAESTVQLGLVDGEASSSITKDRNERSKSSSESKSRRRSRSRSRGRKRKSSRSRTRSRSRSNSRGRDRKRSRNSKRRSRSRSRGRDRSRRSRSRDRRRDRRQRRDRRDRSRSRTKSRSRDRERARERRRSTSKNRNDEKRRDEPAGPINPDLPADIAEAEPTQKKKTKKLGWLKRTPAELEKQIAAKEKKRAEKKAAKKAAEEEERRKQLEAAPVINESPSVHVKLKSISAEFTKPTITTLTASAQAARSKMIEVVLNDRLGKKVRVKCNSDDTILDLKKLAAAQLGTRYEKITIKKWYNIYKDHIRLDDYEIHDGMGLELYYG